MNLCRKIHRDTAVICSICKVDQVSQRCTIIIVRRQKRVSWSVILNCIFYNVTHWLVREEFYFGKFPSEIEIVVRQMLLRAASKSFLNFVLHDWSNIPVAFFFFIRDKKRSVIILNPNSSRQTLIDVTTYQLL